MSQREFQTVGNGDQPYGASVDCGSHWEDSQAGAKRYHPPVYHSDGPAQDGEWGHGADGGVSGASGVLWRFYKGHAGEWPYRVMWLPDRRLWFYAEDTDQVFGDAGAASPDDQEHQRGVRYKDLFCAETDKKRTDCCDRDIDYRRETEKTAQMEETCNGEYSEQDWKSERDFERIYMGAVYAGLLPAGGRHVYHTDRVLSDHTDPAVDGSDASECF